jgi:hypothetical protein
MLGRLRALQRHLKTESTSAASPSPPALQYMHFYTHDEVGAFLGELAAAHPSLCTVGSIGESCEGRAIHSLQLGAGDPDATPHYLVYGCIHAGELSGIHACLNTALCLCAEHDPADPAALLSRVTFTIIPQISPDGADFCARTSASVRSIPHRPDSHESNVIYPADVDGDGFALTMRMEDPDGEFVLDPEEPRLLVKRGADDTGPFYRQFPEGEIFEWDGELDHIKVPREYGQFASDTAGTGGTYTDFVS